jgi:hypothetical protein
LAVKAAFALAETIHDAVNRTTITTIDRIVSILGDPGSSETYAIFWRSDVLPTF